MRLIVEALLLSARESAMRDLRRLSLPANAAERILRRLALRGLARLTPAGWTPTRLLLSDVPLRPCEDGD
jgi:hypothetical protein